MTEKIEELRQVRIQKLEQLKKSGIDPYPVESHRTHLICSALEQFDLLSSTKKEITITGRIRSIRTHGKLTFGNLEDSSDSIQFMLRSETLGEQMFGDFRNFFDIGDFIEVTGFLELSKTGEKTLQTLDYKLLTKSIRPISQEYFGLKDTETRLRKRYLDLLMNPETKEMFRKKALFWQTIRNFMIKKDFLEVWTPVLENVPGGADAEPFMTHHNALDRDFYLRISLELPLKRLLVGGHEKGMKLVEEMFKEVIKNVTGGLVTEYEEQKIDWGNPPAGGWPRLDYFEVFKKETGLDLNSATIADLQKKADALGAPYDKNWGRGKLIDSIYKRTVRQKLVQPCFLVGHPFELSPLAKVDPVNSKKSLRFQVLAEKTELGNGFSEVNDPLYQMQRFQEQMKLREAGDKEAQMLDADSVESYKTGRNYFDS